MSEYTIKLSDKKLYALNKPQMDALVGDAFFLISGERPNRERISYVGSIAILSIRGFIFRYQDWFVDAVDGTSIENLTTLFEEALFDEKISAIVLDINSPGGEVDGTPEFAESIFSARGIKPIHAYVSSIGASAAYWIASAADKVIVQESAAVGSIGVYGTYNTNPESEGEITIVSSVSPNKISDLSTESGINQVKRHVDALGDIFVRNVAKYRGVSEREVLHRFGQGDVRIGHDAVGNGMADSVGSLKSTLAELGGNMQTSVKEPSADATEITKEWVEKNRPDIAQAFRNEGKDQEAVRIKEIETIHDEAYDTIGDEARAFVRSAKFETGLSSNEVARELVRLSFEKRKSVATNRREDANAIPKVKNTGTHEEGTESDRKTVVESIRSGITAWRWK